jgi:hypothetical protein
MLSGVVGSGSRIDSECGGKMPFANATNCTKLQNTRPSTNRNRTFLTLAIPGNIARLWARRVPLPINSERLHAQEALGDKKTQFTLFSTSVSSRAKRTLSTGWLVCGEGFRGSGLGEVDEVFEFLAGGTGIDRFGGYADAIEKIGGAASGDESSSGIGQDDIAMRAVFPINERAT